MHDLYALKGWNKNRDALRRKKASEILIKNNIVFTEPSLGHFKIKSDKCITLMFYPKSGIIIWKKHKTDFQHIFRNSDEGKIIQKLKQLI